MKIYTRHILKLVLIVLMIILILTLNSVKSSYNKLTIVEDKATALSSLNSSIPKSMVIYTNFYSNTIITNKLEINSILNDINNIKKISLKNNNFNKVLESNESSYTVNGKFFYTNNKIDTFALNNKLIFNTKTYIANSYLVNSLHTKLRNYFNTCEHLIQILNTDASNVEHIDKNSSFNFTTNEKKKLAKELTKLIPMDDHCKLHIVKITDPKLYTLKVKINKNIYHTTNNLIFIDIYKNYVVIEFLSEKNGKKSIWRKI